MDTLHKGDNVDDDDDDDDNSINNNNNNNNNNEICNSCRCIVTILIYVIDCISS